MIEKRSGVTDVLIDSRRRHPAVLLPFVHVCDLPVGECRLERTCLDTGDRIESPSFPEVTGQIATSLLMQFHRTGSEFGLAVSVVASEESPQLGASRDITPAMMCFHFYLFLTTHLLRLPLGDRVHAPDVSPRTATIRCHPADDPVGMSFRCLLVESDARTHDRFIPKAFHYI